MSSALFPHPSTLIHFRSFSTPFNHLNFGLPDVLLQPGFPRHTVFTVPLSNHLTRWPSHSTFIILIVVTTFDALYITQKSSSGSVLQLHFTVLQFYTAYCLQAGLGWRSGCHCATNRKVPGSILDGVTGNFFHGIRQFHVPGVDSAS
jgi:hypothetical protein